MMHGSGMEKASTDVLATKKAHKVENCARYWQRVDSAWSKHWGAERWGNLYVRGAQQYSEWIVNKIVADRASLGANWTRLRGRPWQKSECKIDCIALNEFVFSPDEEIYMDATGTSLPSPGQAWSTDAYYVDGAQRHPTGRARAGHVRPEQRPES